MPKKKSLKTPVKTQEEKVTEQEKPTPQKSKKPKKCSSGTPVKTQAKEVSEHEKQAPKSKKPRNVIEEIFAENKRKRIEEEEKSEKEKKEAISKAKKMKKMKRMNEEAKEVGFVAQPSQPKKKTGDGLAIYTEEELGIGKEDAGGTPLCPFDCSCCF